MNNLIAGSIAVVMAVVFLGNYLVMIASIPLSIIIIAVLAMLVVDYVKTVRGDENQPGD